MTHFLVLLKIGTFVILKHDMFISVYSMVSSGGLTTSTELTLSEFLYSLISESLSVCVKSYNCQRFFFENYVRVDLDRYCIETLKIMSQHSRGLLHILQHSYCDRLVAD